jgi:hypothetical protein
VPFILNKNILGPAKQDSGGRREGRGGVKKGKEEHGNGERKGIYRSPIELSGYIPG